MGTQYLEANKDLRLRPSHEQSPGVREGMEEEHTPVSDLARHHQVFEEGDRFESSALRLARC